MEMNRLNSALDLMQRMPPKNAAQNLSDLMTLCPDLVPDLLCMVDQPFGVQKDPQNGKEYILCDYNRDDVSYRSPWSGIYDPPLPEGTLPSEKARKLEIVANDVFEVYCSLYYGGALSSVYFWETDVGLAAAICIKKDTDNLENVKGSWEAMHVIEITHKSNDEYYYKLTSTIMLWLEKSNCDGVFELGGSITRGAESYAKVSLDKPHVYTIGKMVEDLENKMRSILSEVYFGKSCQILDGLRTVETSLDIENKKIAAALYKKVVNDTTS